MLQMPAFQRPLQSTSVALSLVRPPETKNISIESNNLMVIRNNFPFVGHPKSFATVQTGKEVTNNWF